MRTKKPSDVTASPYTPIARGDTLSTVRLYSRTVQNTGATIAVCTFKRSNPDIARAARGYSAGTAYYVKVGDAGFSVHNDTDGCLFLHLDSGSGAHFRALLKLGLKRLTVTNLDTCHGSENTRRRGIALQTLTCEAGGLQLYYHRIDGMSDWFETHDVRPCDGKIFRADNGYRWGDHDVIWCGGLEFEALQEEQRQAVRQEAQWQSGREERQRAAAAAAAETAAETSAETSTETEGN